METGDLNARQDARDDQSRGDEILLLLGDQVGTSTATDNNGRSDDPSQHGQSMLKSKKHSKKDGHLVIETEEWTSLGALLHEGQVRSEQKGVVIFANESIASSERRLEASEAPTKCLFVCMLRHNRLGAVILVHNDVTAMAE